MSWNFDVSVRKGDWMNNPRLRWNKGLLVAGAAWKSENAKYPAYQSPFYIRKGGLRDKSDFTIVDEGKEMQLRSTFYWRYLMFGTGIYGPKGTPIVPKKPGGFLVFEAESGGLYGKGRTTGLIFARSVKGTIWAGRLDEIIEALKQAFALGIKENAD